MSTQKASVKKAFTLTELLVSMAVLGLIATLTLPHMFMSVDRAKKRAVFKEAYQALAEAVHATFLEGGNSDDVIKRLNTRKVCQTHARNEGCTNFSAGVEAQEPGVVLSTGVTVFGLSSSVTSINGIMIGLEEFPKKEYFYLFSNYTDRPWSGPFDNNWPGYELQVVSGTVVQPGELQCVEQACWDMFKND